MAADNVVFVGNKPVMNYVLAVMTQFKNSNTVVLKARGRAISRAVDTAEIIRNRFMTEAQVRSIITGTEEVTTKNETKMKISYIEITLAKSGS